jgi:hypothetical protein
MRWRGRMAKGMRGRGRIDRCMGWRGRMGRCMRGRGRMDRCIRGEGEDCNLHERKGKDWKMLEREKEVRKVLAGRLRMGRCMKKRGRMERCMTRRGRMRMCAIGRGMWGGGVRREGAQEGEERRGEREVRERANKLYPGAGSVINYQFIQKCTNLFQSIEIFTQGGGQLLLLLNFHPESPTSPLTHLPPPPHPLIPPAYILPLSHP